MSDGGWIGVDLDGTLAYYDHWRGHQHIGPPIPLMQQRVKDWLAAKRKVKIFTARVGPGNEEIEQEVRQAIDSWSLEHLGQVLPVTCVKDMQMAELYDDRAVQVEQNTGRLVGRSTRGL